MLPSIQFNVCVSYWEIISDTIKFIIITWANFSTILAELILNIPWIFTLTLTLTLEFSPDACGCKPFTTNLPVKANQMKLTGNNTMNHYKKRKIFIYSHFISNSLQLGLQLVTACVGTSSLAYMCVTVKHMENYGGHLQYTQLDGLSYMMILL